MAAKSAEFELFVRADSGLRAPALALAVAAAGVWLPWAFFLSNWPSAHRTAVVLASGLALTVAAARRSGARPAVDEVWRVAYGSVLVSVVGPDRDARAWRVRYAWAGAQDATLRLTRARDAGGAGPSSGFFGSGALAGGRWVRIRRGSVAEDQWRALRRWVLSLSSAQG